MSLPNDYNEALLFLQEEVRQSRESLFGYTQSLGIDINQLMEIRAILSGLMYQHKLGETEMGLLVAYIVLVIGRENILKGVEENPW